MNSTATATKKILIVEDNHDIIEILTEWLSSIGYEISAHTTVNDMIALIEAHQPDLIILDYLIGDINGGEYCHQIKSNSFTKHIPVMMLSAHQRVIDSLGNYGWDAFVSKPFDLTSLEQQIKALIKN